MIPFFDNHYDLLTDIVINMDAFNKNADMDEFHKRLDKMYINNIKGGIVNLFFMSEDEMKDELDIKDINVVEMFKKVTKQLEFIKMAGFIDEDVKFIYSIEGCDYLNIDDLDELYKLGLRSILPVWNNKNKYGSGNKSEDGLTEKGKNLLRKATELGIIIDLSHMNERTFFDTLEYMLELKNEKFDPTLIASHSNIKDLCDNKRNLSGKQIVAMKYLDVYLGLFTSSKFVDDNYLNLSKDERKQKFLDMVDYTINKLNYPTDRILLSTDDMEYYPNEKYHGYNAFDMKNINIELYNLLKTKFDEETISRIMYGNSMNIYKKINEKDKEMTR